MKRILMVAPSSFPVLDAEAIVNIKLLKTLTNSGDFQVDLISKENKWCNYPSSPILVHQVSLNSINVVSIDNVVNIDTIWGHIKCFFKFKVVFKGSHWAEKALPIAEKLCKANKYDYILTKNESSFLIGSYLKKKYGLKWIATWNDPYPQDLHPYPYGNGLKNIGTIMHKLIIRKMEESDMHIFPNRRLRDYMMSYLKVSKSSTIVIPHVIHNVNVKKEKLSSDVLKIIHSGNISYPRSPKNLMIALKKFVNEVSDRIEFSILGRVDSSIQELIDSNGLQKYVKVLSSIPYEKSLQVLSGYHIAMIIEADCQEGIYLPTKVSDFMQQKKHIFSISPRIGILNDLYKDGKIAYFADVQSVPSIYDTLKCAFEDFSQGKLNENSELYDESYTEESIIKQYLSL